VPRAHSGTSFLTAPDQFTKKVGPRGEAGKSRGGGKGGSINESKRGATPPLIRDGALGRPWPIGNISSKRAQGGAKDPATGRWRSRGQGLVELCSPIFR